MRKNSLTFADCGLNKENNFLEAPMCTCGCGQYANLVFEDKGDVANFIHTMLDEHDCGHCAIFAFLKNDEMLIGIKLDYETKVYCAAGEDLEVGIAEIQKDMEFHCYGLLEQVDDNLYKIIME